MYVKLQVLHISLYIPLFPCSNVFRFNFGFVSCCSVLVFLNAIRMLMCLSMFVILLISGLWYVNVAHIFFVCCSLSVWSLLVVCIVFGDLVVV